METYLGLDLGGTKLLIGEVDSHGNILRYKKYDSGYFNQQSVRWVGVTRNLSVWESG